MFESRINEEIRNFTNDVSDKLMLVVSGERFNSLSAFVTTTQSELRNEARLSLISLKSDVATSIQKLSNSLQTVNITAIRSVERCNNLSDSLIIVTNERLNNVSAFVTTTQSELRNESRRSLISLKSDVETSIQKLSNDFRTVNQTAMKNVELNNNVSDSLKIVTSDLHTVNTFLKMMYLKPCRNAPKSGTYVMYNAKLATPLPVYCD
jgi:DNA-binding ferritin-like protein